MRLFVGLSLPDEIGFSLLNFQPQAAEYVRPVERANLHITLHFLGEADASLIDQALTGVECAPVAICIDHFGQFQGRSMRTLWAGVQLDATLLALHQVLKNALLAAGVKLEKREYRPHVTLARAKRQYDVKAVECFTRQTMAPQQFVAQQFSLFHSDLKLGYPRYTILNFYPLNG